MGDKKNKSTSQFVVCINNVGYPASLELHKIYCVVSDKAAAAVGDLRLIDQSGGDYLYPASCFAPIKVPAALQESLLRASWITLGGDKTEPCASITTVWQTRIRHEQ